MPLNLRKTKIYFLLPEYERLNEDAAVYLAEGLKELNIDFYSNRNYWKLDSDHYLFVKNPAFDPSEDADIVIITDNWTEFIEPGTFKRISSPIPQWLYKKNRKFKTVYIDTKVGYNTIGLSECLRNFDFILRTMKNKKTKRYDNIYPWVLGFQNRVLNEKLNLPVKNKHYEIAYNFNFSHPYVHPLRALTEKTFINLLPQNLINRKITPPDKPNNTYSDLMWQNSVGLHNPDYYHHIENTLMVASFCGELIPALPNDPKKYMAGGKKATIKKKLYKVISTLLNKNERLIQWDSWRFWETLALGSVPIHIDLEKYGVELPVMPKNWEHYIGIDLNNIDYAIKRILEDRESIYKIAAQGHQWAMENYSPKVSAQRFLQLMNSK
ncbi:glycosyltransferase [Pedobacter montanisoli]|uniref:Glycosyltransferase family 1 protein n=1 Tax=Pedobacter montanisoli TaxID=2923277 RepID=A0ABS9ZVW2_9SPHI|nr:hypothetical protein [Pedobacter montanisoli]MCJ0742443.1 hypothetical protein [Pedobacter montanisoli]